MESCQVVRRSSRHLDSSDSMASSMIGFATDEALGVDAI